MPKVDDKLMKVIRNLKHMMTDQYLCLLEWIRMLDTFDMMSFLF